MAILLVGATLILGSNLVASRSERRLALLVGLFVFLVGLYLENG